MPNKRAKNKKFFGGFVDRKLLADFTRSARRQHLDRSKLLVKLMTDEVERYRGKKKRNALAKESMSLN